jgi:acetyl-CoA C-acetyltransferase
VDAERTPVIVAAAQLSDQERACGAADLAKQVAASALAASPGLAGAVERVSVVNILARSGGAAPASVIASELGLRNAVRCETTTVGGCAPLHLLGRASADIVAGRLQATLIVGAEAVRAGRLRGQSGPRLTPTPTRAPEAEPEPEPDPDPVIGDDRLGSSPEEIAAGLYIPVYIYPLFESALAARAGRFPAEQRRFAAEVMAPFTAVAARNPHAWFPIERSPAELATPSPSNRLVAEPYTKLLTAFLGGSQASALVVTSLAVARSLGLAEGAVAVRSVASADDVWYPSARPDFGASPAAGAAIGAALAAAGFGLDDLDHLDIYSCFPSAVQMAAAAAGLDLDDERGLTVTGGLPYFGGPGNNYATHSLASLFELLRERPGTGLVTSVSWFMTKHAAACLSSLAGDSGGFVAGDTAGEQDRIDSAALPVVPAGEALAGEGALVVAGTVIYDRTGGVSGAPVIATLDDGRRVVAAAHSDDLAGLAGVSLVGHRVDVLGDPPTFRVRE